jgi:hypothetical protein
MNKAQVEELVRRVLEELKRQKNEEKKQILLIIDVKKSIIEQTSADMEELRNGGNSLIAVTTPCMKEYVLGLGLYDAVYDSGTGTEIRGVIEGSVAIGALSMGFSTLAKISMGISETLPEITVARALRMGRPITFCLNGCLPADLSEGVGQGYLRMIVGHLRTIVSFGCGFVKGEAFCRSLGDAVRPRAMKAGKTTEAGGYPCIDRRVITKKDILEYSGLGGVIIPEKALITDEAREWAAKGNMTILRKLA